MSSYLDIADASAYFANRLHTSAWDNAEDVDRNKSLIMATSIIDRLNFLGEKTDSAQELQFPRFEDSSIPQEILDACAEIALKLLEGFDPELEFENLSMVSQSYANVKSTYDRSRVPEHLGSGVPSIIAWRLLKPYLRDARTIDLSRAT